ncbi:AraC family transcriptional regulator [Rhodococcus opacus]|uniref:HTH araC/xylS-type domain-containing protein n=1 Tax=Rhodococcus opacus TaxID=37919 RepID=A0A2S8IK49_RHOOP|nr:AraC family transcriptional regulator [Rhodococcus opacus]PQP15151.1 hypothetical protein C5613_39025 [Rhodococcus opacus]
MNESNGAAEEQAPQGHQESHLRLRSLPTVSADSSDGFSAAARGGSAAGTIATVGRTNLQLGSSLWEEEVGLRIAAMTMNPRESSHAESLLTKRDLGEILVSEWSSPSFDGRPLSNKTKSHTYPDSFFLLAVSEGQQSLEAGGEHILLRSGAILLTSGPGADRFWAPAWVRKTTVKIPSELLIPHLGGAQAPRFLVTHSAQSPLARLLTDTLNNLADNYEQMSPLELNVARRVLIDLVVGIAMANPPDSDGIVRLPRIRAAAENWIIEQLATGEAPQVDEAARALNVSRRTVQRAFAATNDTVRGVIRRHRISEVKRDLLRTSSTLMTLAEKWGYSDASHLTREFKGLEGCTPGEFRRQFAGNGCVHEDGV